MKGLRCILIPAMCLMLTTAQAQLLYEISGRSAKAKSYLFATNRLTDISFLDTVPNLFKAYANCDRVITEMAINDLDALKALAEAAMLPDSAQLRDLYSYEEYEQINQAMQLSLNLSLDKVGRMKPSYLTELYRNELLRKWADYDENRSLENFFQVVASEQNKPLEALDGIGGAIYMTFDREPMHWQVKELLRIIEYPEREIRLEKSIAELYRNGRLTDISYQVAMPDNQSTLSYSDYQVYCQRNLTWAKRLEPYLSEGKCFICLNAIYLGGDKGLIAVLRQNGYKVKPMNKGMKN